MNTPVFAYDDAWGHVTRNTITSNDRRNPVAAGIDRDKYVASIGGVLLAMPDAGLSIMDTGF